ncbi:MBL fold metallo-hydrolase [Paenibacillus pasadenensis]|uniref:MBL fold metallo-hydrolase n=1 Tax=Paenibacillus pasadenensis TaxID=217090 RepID=UPI00203F8274|nr:MBL fold metallo-hydrolase [Paenibacillus pasadenensis]MCM3746761.1 MBL fold metallo-hydrolase [Paenibacillus pasadenensis]
MNEQRDRGTQPDETADSVREKVMREQQGVRPKPDEAAHSVRGISGGLELSMEQLSGGWLRILVPLPYSLRYVNSYLVPEPEGDWTVIDPGLNTDEARGLWLAALERLGIGQGKLRRVLLTHQHPDHYGLAGWFQQRYGCPVVMTELSHRYAQRMWGADSSRFAAELSGWFGRHGMPEELLEQLGPHFASFTERVEPQPEVTYVAAGRQLEMGGEQWLLIDAPGHAGGALCLYSESSRTMIAGDQVLLRITPNISLIPGPDEDPNPLRSYLTSLQQLSEYEVEAVYPGHREPFRDLAGRAAEIAAHHERRLEHLLGLLRESGPASAFQLCELEFGSHLRRNIHNMRFAMSETLAHLAYLAAEGKAEERETAAGALLFSVKE